MGEADYNTLFLTEGMATSDYHRQVERLYVNSLWYQRIFTCFTAMRGRHL